VTNVADGQEPAEVSAADEQVLLRGVARGKEAVLCLISRPRTEVPLITSLGRRRAGTGHCRFASWP
jgi:hypothetical protein